MDPCGLLHLDRDGCADPHHSDGNFSFRSSAIAARAAIPAPRFVQSAACGSFVAGLTTAINELPFRARAHARA
jgi:hypothetical protein